MRTRLSRRDFLGLTGAAAITGGIACVGSIIGYLLLDRLTQTEPTIKASPVTPRPNQQKHIDRPAITSRSRWNAREPNHAAENEPGFYTLTNFEGWREYEEDLRIVYQTVVVHHSALYQDDDITTMQTIQNKHMDERKWADIGYHFGVGRTGEVFEGRALNVRGTHVEGHNTGSVGVVFFGNFEDDQPTPEQLEVGRRLIDWLALRLELSHLAGHRDFNDFTKCPGKNMIAYLSVLAASAGLILGTGGYEPPPEQLTPTTPP